MTVGDRWLLVAPLLGDGPKPTIQEVAAKHGVNPKTVSKWLQRAKDSHDVQDLRGRGRKKAMSEGACKAAVELLVANKCSNVEGVAEELNAQGLTNTTLDRTTVSRSASKYAKLVGAPIRPYRGKPQRALTAGNKEKRVAFARAHAGMAWHHIMFSDRCKLYLGHPGSVVKRVWWSRKGEKPKVASVTHPMCVNIYAGMTVHGMSKVHIVDGSSNHHTKYCTKKGAPARGITQQEYRHVLSDTLLPGGDHVFEGKGVHDWVLQQDNDTSHKPAAQVIRNWSCRHTTSPKLLADWPPNSPDLNPIENVWAIVKAEADALGLKSFAEFKSAVISHIQHFPVETLRSLYASMPTRMQEVIASKGERLRH